jgi:hypothetical protein|tara:strand:- start:823 stop:939 length:117 start_codon:yes stop_codon:yes gene_type:complete
MATLYEELSPLREQNEEEAKPFFFFQIELGHLKHPHDA